MKKILAILTTAVIVLCMGTTAFAAEFTPSVSEKDAPTIVQPETDVAGTVVDSKGNVTENIAVGMVVITPVSKSNTSDKIPAAAKQQLEKAYNEVKKSDTKLSTIMSALNDAVKKALGEGKTADDLVIRDLFDVTVLNEDGNERQFSEDNRLVLTFNLGVAADAHVFVAKYNSEGVWESAYSVTNNGDGTVTCEFSHLCPIALMVENTADSATTGDNSVSVFVWAGIALVAAALIVVLFVVKKKDKTAA